ncbi:hypothetical protein AK34_1764 [Burkholderia dolosa AU0158]|jgi:hypothetical protein|nr:hypothetical protein AK34_1764 [Burkholderia dolosa AU0158]VWC07914.1 hypothetical protein BDO18943_05163 [Burkholderia dolosa]
MAGKGVAKSDQAAEYARKSGLTGGGGARGPHTGTYPV